MQSTLIYWVSDFNIRIIWPINAIYLIRYTTSCCTDHERSLLTNQSEVMAWTCQLRYSHQLWIEVTAAGGVGVRWQRFLNTFGVMQHPLYWWKLRSVSWIKPRQSLFADRLEKLFRLKWNRKAVCLHWFNVYICLYVFYLLTSTA